MVKGTWHRFIRCLKETPFEIVWSPLSLYLGVRTLVVDSGLTGGPNPGIPIWIIAVTMGMVATGGVVTFIARLWRDTMVHLERAGIILLVVTYVCVPTYQLTLIGVTEPSIYSVVPNYAIAFIFSVRYWTLGQALRAARRVS